jgi:predicted  nucleic acid-binding Zn-ribbon protein
MPPKTSTQPATLADCRQIADQLRDMQRTIPTNGPRASGVHDFHSDVTALRDKFGLMERRAALVLQDLPSYSADRDTEAHALTAEIASTKTQRDNIAQAFQRLKDERAQPLARLEAAAATADAQTAHIADGTAGTLDTRKLDAEVRRSADALEEESERLAAVNGRLQAIGAEIAQAEADASARTKELNDKIQSLEQSAQELTIDTAAGLYVLTLAHALRDPHELPKFDLKIHDARRVPFVSGRAYEVCDHHIKDFLRAQAAPTPEEWKAEVVASGVLGFEYTPVPHPHIANTANNGWSRSVTGR